MNTIAFIDVETDVRTGKILDVGYVDAEGRQVHSASVSDLLPLLKEKPFLCGHNFVKHDWMFLKQYLEPLGFGSQHLIDTLFWSPLLFPSKPYHSLVKDDKLEYDDANNPLNDAIKARILLDDEISAFYLLSESLKEIFYLLLNDKTGFSAFFRYIGYSTIENDLAGIIRKVFSNQICAHVPVEKLVDEYPVEMAYALSLINSESRYSITPPWVLRSLPEVEKVFAIMRNKPCFEGCGYCKNKLDALYGLKEIFGFDSFRSYDRKPLEQQAADAALQGNSLLAVFPTGGGKSVTFQLPALLQGQSVKGLTVVISPLQSLMKDQVDNLEKLGITEAVTINGLLDPIERSKSLERVEDGSASLLYISPESLRSLTIERALLGRNVVRFVIDEAHCFSSWGQDFRVDYLYIGDFIRSLVAKNQLSIHLKGSWLDNLVSVDGLKVYSDRRMWQMPEILTVQLTHRDVWLDYYRNKQREISGIKAGAILRIDGYDCCNTKGHVLLKFSRGFQNFIDDLNQKGYLPVEAVVNFVVWWKKEDDAKEIKILLPHIRFKNSKSGTIPAG